ncbi:response regulator [Ramlibacter pallidus]|uniref:histidine kinase n=1 Tax=Ramlibacter pallidus TaxID=2780087 RepID=A0ABR9S7J1_9BURK|nr:response regulator [Ramlibacter pallidus]MBE7369247.1 response regulator [Ramlibacter pallidus]
MAMIDDLLALRPPAGASPRAPGELAEGFVDAHRQKIFLGLSLAGTLLLGPFAINNFFQDRLVLGLATSGFVVCLLANALAILRGRRAPVPATLIFVVSVIGLATAMYNNGLIGILWVYPGILLFHFMLPRRRANLFNVTLVAMAIPMAWMHLTPQLTMRVGVTLILLLIFSNIFSYIADAQQAKEAEQRDKLDALVRQLEAQNNALREAFRLREEVERIARHDLKTPLASIASVPRLLRERHSPDAQEAELLGMVERAALRVLSMVNLSLDLYRMEEGTYRLRAQAVDLAGLVQTVSRELQAHTRSKNLRLVLDLPAEPLYAQGEELLCYSTLANVLKNALEASPEGAEVRVTLRRYREHGEDAVVLEIHNRGEVPAEIRESFFAKYNTFGKPGGTGLGAYSARLMARVQRGDLSMKSGPDGTTLTLGLPRWRGPAPVRSVAGTLPPQAGAQVRTLPPLSVLVVDDDEYNIVVLKNLLPSPPLNVRTAVNGRAALEQVREVRPDVIFMDVEMPVMGGIEAVRQLRELQRERGERPSIVAAFSANDDETTRRRCLEAGFDLYLAKPASREEVFAVLLGHDPADAPSSDHAPLQPDDRRVRIEPWMVPLLPQFLASRLELTHQLAAAVEGQDRERLRVLAHKLAGSLAMYNFWEASGASRALEQAAASEAFDALRARCEGLARMLAESETVVREVAA